MLLTVPLLFVNFKCVPFKFPLVSFCGLSFAYRVFAQPLLQACDPRRRSARYTTEYVPRTGIWAEIQATKARIVGLPLLPLEPSSERSTVG